MKIANHIVEDAKSFRQRFFHVSRILNGNIEFGGPTQGPINVRGTFVSTVTPNVANTEFTVTHNLGYIPSIMFFSSDAAGHVYRSRYSQWTTTKAFFKSDQANLNFTGFLL